MPETELVEAAALHSPLVNLILLAEQVMPYTTNALVDAFYYGNMSLDEAWAALDAIVF